MIEVSQAYKDAVKAPAREWKGRVKAYLDGEGNDPTIFDDDDIVEFEFLEEAEATSGSPLGQVSSNEFTLVLDNHDRRFTPNNVSSPFYKKLVPDIKLEPELGLVLPDDSVEYIPLGVFYSGDWESPSDSIECTVTGNDKLYKIRNRRASYFIPVIQNTSIATLFEILFNSVDEEYQIEATDRVGVDLGFIPKESVGSVADKLAEAGMYHVLADRQGIPTVRDFIFEGFPVATWTDEDILFGVENPYKYRDIADRVVVSYKRPRLSEPDTVLSLEEPIQSGENVILNAEFDDPVAEISRVFATGEDDVSVNSFDYGAFFITMNLDSQSQQEADIDVRGRKVEFESIEKREGSPGKETIVDNKLIQGKEQAEVYAERLYNYMSQKDRKFELDSRDDPAIEIGDVIEVIAPSKNVQSTRVAIVSRSLSYDGGVRSSLKARKVI